MWAVWTLEGATHLADVQVEQCVCLVQRVELHPCRQKMITMCELELILGYHGYKQQTKLKV